METTEIKNIKGILPLFFFFYFSLHEYLLT